MYNNNWEESKNFDENFTAHVFLLLILNFNIYFWIQWIIVFMNNLSNGYQSTNTEWNVLLRKHQIKFNERILQPEFQKCRNKQPERRRVRITYSCRKELNDWLGLNYWVECPTCAIAGRETWMSACFPSTSHCGAVRDSRSNCASGTPAIRSALSVRSTQNGAGWKVPVAAAKLGVSSAVGSQFRSFSSFR